MRLCEPSIAAALLLTAACAHHAVLPHEPAARYATFAEAKTYEVESFRVRGLSGIDTQEHQDRLHADFEARLPLAPAAQEEGAKPLPVHVHLTVERTTLATGILDYITLTTLAPWWGHVDGVMRVRVQDPARRYILLDAKYETRAPFFALFLPLWRTDYIEDAYADVYQQLFTEAAALLTERRDELLAAARSAQGEVAETPAPVTATSDRVLGPMEPRPRRNAMRLVTDRPRPRPGIAGALLDNLGGVEVTGLYGAARVTSRARTDWGAKQEIAAGDARQTGYRVATYAAPRASGFYLVPSFGYLDQRIAIADFRQALPQASSPGEEIGAVCSDPTTYASLDCLAPNVYGLRMQSGFGGARAGGHLVGSNGSLELFASAELAVNLLEYRNVRARVGSYRARGDSWAFLESGSAGGGVGLRVPSIHLGLHLTGEYQLYRRFRYAEPLEFKGFVEYNADKQAYERPRTWVRAASLGVWSFTWSAAVAF